MPTLVSPEGVSNSVNSKVGHSLNLPAGLPEHGGTCPGATDICRAVCYGCQGRFASGMGGAIMAARNWAVLKDSPRAILGLTFPGVRPGETPLAQRLFGVGDFWSVAAVNAAFDLCELHPERCFWLYTRSRQLVGRVLRRRAKPANLTIFASADRDNHRAAKRWAARHGFPVAYMATPGDYIPGEGEAFLCPELDPGKKDRFPLTRVAADAPCQKCKFCWSPKVAEHRRKYGVVFPTHAGFGHPMAATVRGWLDEWHVARAGKVAK